MLIDKRVDPRTPDTVEWGDLTSETKVCAEFANLAGRYGIRTTQFFNPVEIDVYVGLSETELTRITSGDPSPTEFYADGGSGYILVNAVHVGENIRADYYPGGTILTAEVLDSDDFKGPQGDTGATGAKGPQGDPGDITTNFLTGFVAGPNSPIAATDTVLEAFQKTQAQLNAAAGDVATQTHAATEKTTLDDDDELPIADSAASWVLKRVKFSSLKTALQTALQTAFANLFVKPGTYIQFAGTSAPTGYLACNGAAVSRSTYADLFAVISTTYGVGDGSTTFNLPDARGLVMVGAGNHGTMTRANGTPFGGGSVGATRNDQQQGHVHGVTNQNVFGGDQNPFAGGQFSNPGSTGAAATDGTNGPPRIGDETRPAEIAALVCVKY